MAKRQRNPLYDYTWQKLRKQVLNSNTICWICGKPGSDSVDHVIPVSINPALAHDLTNLRPAHLVPCNTGRGNGTRKTTNPTSRRW